MSNMIEFKLAEWKDEPAQKNQKITEGESVFVSWASVAMVSPGLDASGANIPNTSTIHLHSGHFCRVMGDPRVVVKQLGRLA